MGRNETIAAPPALPGEASAGKDVFLLPGPALQGQEPPPENYQVHYLGVYLQGCHWSETALRIFIRFGFGFGSLSSGDGDFEVKAHLFCMP